MKKTKKVVTLKSIFESPQWQNSSAKLPLAIGKDEKGEVVIADLVSLPHLLIGGTTGSGKSVCMDSIILGLLSKFSPDDLHLILADLKVVEFTQYQDVPHLQFPVATSCEETLTALQWCVAEIERRYQVLGTSRCREIHQYNDAGYLKLPYIVFILDELADLMVNDKKLAEKVESAIVQICQKGHTVGIHIIISTARPSRQVITPLIDRNISARLAFRTPSYICSEVILGKRGAEMLSGYGDMLALLPSNEDLISSQGAYADDQMIKAFINTLIPYKQHKQPEIDPLDLPIENLESVADEIKKFIFLGDTNGFLEALRLVIAEPDKAAARYLQMYLHIGYNRAVGYMDLLRERGVIPK